MPRSISNRELIKRLRTFGFAGPNSGTKHMFMTRDGFKLRIPNPHKGDISRFLLSEVLKQAGIKREEWDK